MLVSLSPAECVNTTEVKFDRNTTTVAQYRKTRLSVCQALRIDRQIEASYFPQP